jgi:putative DNA primase/helicase
LPLWPGDRVEPLRWDRMEEFESIWRRAARWARDFEDQLRGADPRIPAEISSDRARDNWRPLLSIADLAGSGWSDRARRAAVILEGDREGEDSAKMLLLKGIRDLFESRGADRLSSQDIVTALLQDEDSPWPDWNHGRGLTKAGLARLLRGFGIRPKLIRPDSGDVARGYHLADLHDAFDRYLSSDASESKCYSVTNLGREPLGGDLEVLQDPSAVTPAIARGSSIDAICNTVTVSEPHDIGGGGMGELREGFI